jgi:hypothetical protein
VPTAKPSARRCRAPHAGLAPIAMPLAGAVEFDRRMAEAVAAGATAKPRGSAADRTILSSDAAEPCEGQRHRRRAVARRRTIAGV